MAKITLFGHGKTPNPHKVLILLEELGVDYEIVQKELNDSPNGIKHENFTKINPNGRVPAIIDHTNDDFVVWESGTILSYLAERFESTGKYLGKSLKERTEVSEWLAFQISGNGPIQGQVFWFKFYHPVKGLDQSVYDRYLNETLRVYGVLEKRLSEPGREYIALDRLTIAGTSNNNSFNREHQRVSDETSIPDIAFYAWVSIAGNADISTDKFPKLQAYVSKLAELPSFKAAASKLVAH
ncbi:hypothetical protein Clacol_004668 [Clathrus columnatus]|uniref:Glutathione S-transferase n=1 Tax=Clathrus columnatus TaxID=1419009 RepID=A0AAV5A744_9AGAM|nr:hypothetical protein Clacol_004668 [Clathrus columnatus]